ncbi:extracellular solute-binding protein [Microbacterium sp. STN6]|uniref:extracellular solute-binding protein n=1 Tax=Microbacterium sp. STN6 TaxID=2995588 RepID=UPI002260E2A2|nr:extracellular solute-binding protein [Microbacterium sp. STN6]MCX7522979.1 extracellular solute-binding protein [Microbacterium sp. STN6]
MKRRHTRWMPVVAVAAAAALALAGCAPGSGGNQADKGSTGKVQTDVSSLGKVTLTVWDQETTPGISDSLDELNKEFHQKYSNVKIDRVVRSGSDLRTTLKLALSSKNPPDVIQANQGYADMAAYVKAGLLTDLGPYEDAYGWAKRFPSSQLALDSVSKDGSSIGGGNLYGVSITGEMVGVFYNKSVLDKLGLSVPKSMDEFEAQLPKIKNAGMLPISFGDQDKSPAIHLLSIPLIPALGQQKAADLVFHRSGSFTSQPATQAAQTLADWASKGYVTPGFNGINSNSAATTFGQGGSAYFLGGVWNQNAIQEAGAGETGAGFTVLPQKNGDPLVAMGGIGMGWAIPSGSKQKDAAAAYIDFISSSKGMDVLQKNSQLPAVPSGNVTPKEGTLTADVVKTWSDLTKANGLVPYIDWSTPTFYDTIVQYVQSLMGGQEDVSTFTSALQKDYAGFSGGK